MKGGLEEKDMAELGGRKERKGIRKKEEGMWRRERGTRRNRIAREGRTGEERKRKGGRSNSTVPTGCPGVGAAQQNTQDMVSAECTGGLGTPVTSCEPSSGLVSKGVFSGWQRSACQEEQRSSVPGRGTPELKVCGAARYPETAYDNWEEDGVGVQKQLQRPGLAVSGPKSHEKGGHCRGLPAVFQLSSTLVTCHLLDPSFQMEQGLGRMASHRERDQPEAV